MSTACGLELHQILAQLPDSQGLKGRRKPLTAMLTAVVSEVLGVARNSTALVE